jgi:hypothetical protein
LVQLLLGQLDPGQLRQVGDVLTTEDVLAG